MALQRHREVLVEDFEKAGMDRSRDQDAPAGEARGSEGELEAELRRSEQRLKSIFRAAPVGIGQVADRVLLEVNERVCEMVGYTAEELIGQNARMLYPSDEEFERVGREKYAQILERGTGTVETRWRRKDGALIDVLLSSSPLAPGDPSAGVTFTALDITSRKRAERERDRLFDLSLDMFCIAGFDGYFKQINPAWQRLLGWTAQEMLSKPWIDFVHPEDHPATDKALEQLAQGESVISFENRYRCRDGSFRRISWNSYPLLAEGLICSVARDITGQVALEARLRQSEKLEAVGQLAGGVAHDFNNILTSILGNVELARAELAGRVAPGDALHQEIEEIRRGALRAADLTRQLLAFGRCQPSRPQLLDLNHTLAEMERMLRRLITKQIKLEHACAPDLSSVLADPAQIEQVVMNLVLNARDAMPEGGTLRLETANVHLDERTLAWHVEAGPGPYVMLAVSDSGCGMDAETLERAFEPFFTTKEVGEGTGLGLSTVYGIVRQSGGHVTVESEPGRGSTLRVYLPAAAAAGTACSAPSAAEEDLDHALAGSETVLVCEDDPAVRGLMVRMLARAGYAAIEAASGFQALEIARGHEGQIHLLVTDIIMPDMDGKRLAGELEQAAPGVKTLFVSGYTADVIARHGVLEEGVQLLEKPFDRRAFLARVRALLDE
ncbi:MAG: PAS domain S-box protein [Planctomycetes bacterium]|nr:PAS domain S-box protein [Planctomycetota bacterium]